MFSLTLLMIADDVAGTLPAALAAFAAHRVALLATPIGVKNPAEPPLALPILLSMIGLALDKHLEGEDVSLI